MLSTQETELLIIEIAAKLQTKRYVGPELIKTLIVLAKYNSPFLALFDRLSGSENLNKSMAAVKKDQA